MNTFDRIIGYSSIKKELMQISDTLKNREAYEKLGAALSEKSLLSAVDIERIRSECKIVSVAI